MLAGGAVPTGLVAGAMGVRRPQRTEVPPPSVSQRLTRPGFDPDATAIASVPPARRIADLDDPSLGAADDQEVSQEIVTANLVHRPASRGVLVAMGVLVLALLVVLPGYFVLSEGGQRSPGYTLMNSLAVPSWASEKPHDAAFYSRFCVDECQIIERDATSTGSVTDTESVYTSKLRADGWIQAPASDCTTKVTGSYTCWLLDARELDLWVTPATCSTPPTTRTGVPDPSEPSTAPKTCVPTAVQIKIFDQIERSRVRAATTG
jgi:hypothetical protein